MEDRIAVGLAALSAVGGLAAVGHIIDLFLYQDRKRVEAYSRAWRLRFKKVRWSNFGRAESEEAVRLIDRWVGPSFFSLKRWKIVLSIAGIALVLSALLSIVAKALEVIVDGEPFIETFRERWTGPDEITGHDVLFTFLMMLILVVPLALSPSVLRGLAVVLSRHSPPGVAGFGFFLALTLVHVVLWLYWSRIIVSLVVHLVGLVLGSGFTLDLLAHDLTTPRPVEDAARTRFSFLFLDFWIQVSGWGAVSIVYEHLLAFVANGARVLFSLAFLSSFLFGPVVQPFVSRLWYGLIKSKKPFFTTILGGIGAIGGALHVLLK